MVVSAVMIYVLYGVYFVANLFFKIGWKRLQEDVDLLSATEPQFTSLIWPLNGEDPDVAFSGVPYEKVSTVL